MCRVMRVLSAPYTAGASHWSGMAWVWPPLCSLQICWALQSVYLLVGAPLCLVGMMAGARHPVAWGLGVGCVVRSRPGFTMSRRASNLI